MVVSWITGDGAKGQVVQYGSLSGKFDKSVDAVKQAGYNRLDMCGGTAKGKGFRDPGTFWSATMSGLVPGDKIHYRYGSEQVIFQQTCTLFEPLSVLFSLTHSLTVTLSLPHSLLLSSESCICSVSLV